MFPEVISNGLASLQEGKLRYVKTVRIEFTAEPAEGATSASSTARSANRKRFTYDEVQAILNDLASRERQRPERPRPARPPVADARRLA